MEKKSFKKYFEQGKGLLITGIILAAVGGGAYLSDRWFWWMNYFLWVASIFTAVAGAVFIICHFSVTIKDESVDNYCKEMNKYLEAELTEYVKATEKHRNFNRVFSYVSGGYDLWDENIETIKFGSDNTPRCEKYGAAALTFTPETLYIVTGTLDLFNGEYLINKICMPISDIKSVETVDKSFAMEYKKRNRVVECCVAEIAAASTAVSFTVHEDAMTDEAVSKIKRIINS